MELILVRHGRPEPVAVASGPADPPLAAIGRRQAEAVADLLAAEPIDLIVSSPLKRARETAAPLAAKLGVEPVLIPEIAEIDQHSSSYVPLEELKAAGGKGWADFVANPKGIHGNNDLDAFADIVYAAMDKLILDNPSRRVVAFCHGLVTMAFLQRMLESSDIYSFRFDYGAISRVQASSGGVRTVRSLNTTADLGETFILSP